MGTFTGHLLPGATFVIIALWWSVTVSLRLRVNPRAFRNRACHPWPGRSVSAESWLKIGFCSVGIVGEAWTAMQNGRFTHIGNLQHITMYAFFLLSGVVDILCARQRTTAASNNAVRPRSLLPAKSDMAMLMLAAIIEWLLFRFHLHGRSGLDVLVHTLLGHAIMAAVLIGCAEMAYPRAHILAYLRCAAVLTQGLWFISVGYILHNPWGPPPLGDPENHEAHMVATCLFAWHILASVGICAAMATLSKRCLSCVSGVQVEYSRCANTEEASLKHPQMESEEEEDC